MPGLGGAVTEVAIEEGHHGNAYVMTVGGTKLQMDEHGRVANGPIDLLQWEGRSRSAIVSFAAVATMRSGFISKPQPRELAAAQ